MVGFVFEDASAQIPCQCAIEDQSTRDAVVLGGVEPLKGDCSGYIGHVGSYEECAGNKSSNNETDQCDYDDCNNVFSMAVGLARRWHSIALLRIRIVWRVCSSLHGCTGAGRLETRTARGAIGCC